jgi:integrase
MKPLPTDKTKITDAHIRTTAERVSIGDGLYLTEKTDKGGKSWRFNYRFPKGGKQYTMTYGQYPDVGLAAAKKLHQAAREKLAAGINPMAEKKDVKLQAKIEHENSLKSVAARYLAWWEDGKEEDHVKRTHESWKKDIFPLIGHMPINSIEATDIIAVAKAVEARGAQETARRVWGQMDMCFAWAVEHKIARRNPARDVNRHKILKPMEVVSFAAVEPKKVPELMQKIELGRNTPVTRLALKLLAHTFVRPGKEFLGWRWDEIDWSDKTWVIPKERCKKRREHVVPLSTQTIALLRQLHSLTGDSPLLFPAGKAANRAKGQALSDNTFNQALKRMGYKGKQTGHGFRSIASTILYKSWPVEAPLSPGLKEDYIEMQMNHLTGKGGKGKATRRIYDRNLYLEERTVLMQWWGDYLEKASTGQLPTEEEISTAPWEAPPSKVLEFPVALAS